MRDETIGAYPQRTYAVEESVARQGWAPGGWIRVGAAEGVWAGRQGVWVAGFGLPKVQKGHQSDATDSQKNVKIR